MFLEQGVDVVGHAPNLDGLHLILAGDATQEGPESFAEFRGNQRPALFGAENAMVVGADVRHALIQPSLRDLGDIEFSIPTLKRWAILSLSLRDRDTRELPNASGPWLIFCPAPGTWLAFGLESQH